MYEPNAFLSQKQTQEGQSLEYTEIRKLPFLTDD